MNGKLYHVVFCGDILDEFEIDKVKDDFSKLYDNVSQSMDTLFSGRRVILKKCILQKEAINLTTTLKSIGLKTQIEVNSSDDGSSHSSTNGINASARKNKNKATLNECVENVAKVSEDDELEVVSTSSDQASTADQFMGTITFSQRLRYRFDTFMAKGGASTFKALSCMFFIFFLVIASLRGLFVVFSPDVAQQYGELDFLGNVYITLLQLTDPGNMAQDILSSPWYKSFAILSGIIGIILLSSLVALITTALDQKLSELKRGHSRVIEKNHTIILGWNEERVIEVIRELIMANESEPDGCVVILADKDKQVMDDILRVRLTDRATTRVVTRSGQTTSISSLALVSIEHCRSVVVLAACEDSATEDLKAASDARVIQSLLAAEGFSHEEGDFCIVAEIYSEAYRDIVENSFPDHVVMVNTSDILAKLLVQTSRSVGLSVVYSELLSFDGCEMYFCNKDWLGKTFGELMYHFPDGVPLGIRSVNGDIVLRPEPSYKLEETDDILIVADDDSTIEVLPEAVASPDETLICSDRKLVQEVERELIIGWNHKAPIILNEFADYVCRGSDIDILLKAPTGEQCSMVERLNQELELVNIKIIEGDCLNRDHLLKLKPLNYNNIIILANSGDDVDTQKIDSANIVCLLLIKSIFNQFDHSDQGIRLITEILDSQNYPLVARVGVKDVIISNRLVSMIMAQISESSDIKRVYDNIFEEDGSEIYLKPAVLYFDSLPVELTFADLMLIAQQREEICIGVKIKALEGSSENNFGVRLIPLKGEKIVIGPEDSLVVLSEDEL